MAPANANFGGIVQIESTLCFYNLEGKPRLVALCQLHVDSLIRDDHLVPQVPLRAPAELGHDGVAVAEEVDVEVGVGAWLGCW